MPDGGTVEHRLTRLPAQREFMRDRTSGTCALIGGFGSGKSRALAYKLIDVAEQNGPAPTLFLAPTYKLIKDNNLRVFREVFDTAGMVEGEDYRVHISDMRLTLYPGTAEQHDVYLLSAEHPERIVAYTVGSVLLDEPGMMDEEVPRRARERMRDGRAKIRQLAMGGTPDGGLDSWLYRDLEEKRLPDTNLIRARTTDNPFLPREFVPTLLARYSPEQVKAYLNGEFVNLFAGQVYNYFDTDKHCRPFTGPIAGDVVIGADFNYELCCWVVGVVMGDRGHVVGEIVGEHTNTYAMVEAAIAWLRDFFRQHDGTTYADHEIARMVTFHVDASSSGHHTSSRASLSDAQIIRSRGFRTLHDASNPGVKDRVNTLNNRFRTSRLLIDKERAPRTVRALRAQVYKNGAPEKGKGHDGFTDALGYLAWYADASSWRAIMLKPNETDYGRMRR